MTCWKQPTGSWTPKLSLACLLCFLQLFFPVSYVTLKMQPYRVFAAEPLWVWYFNHYTNDGSCWAQLDEGHLIGQLCFLCLSSGRIAALAFSGKLDCWEFLIHYLNLRVVCSSCFLKIVLVVKLVRVCFFWSCLMNWTLYLIRFQTLTPPSCHLHTDKCGPI